MAVQIHCTVATVATATACNISDDRLQKVTVHLSAPIRPRGTTAARPERHATPRRFAMGAPCCREAPPSLERAGSLRAHVRGDPGERHWDRRLKGRSHGGFPRPICWGFLLLKENPASLGGSLIELCSHFHLLLVPNTAPLKTC